jgi:hypothetical protein
MQVGTSLGGLALIVTASGVAHSQTILLTGPLAPTPPEYWVGSVPAQLEWTYWASGGLVVTDSARSSNSNMGALAAIGGELTFEILRYDGFPSGWYGGDKGDAELRLGPWVSAATRASGGLVEGGVKLHLGGIFHASFGTWDLRIGGGHAAYEDSPAPHMTGTFAYGVRSALARYPRDRRETWSDRLPQPKLIAEASVARLFVTYRLAFDLAETRELVFGVELSPTFLLPPHTLWRLGGGPPWSI